jgi:hypothetical protein
VREKETLLMGAEVQDEGRRRVREKETLQMGAVLVNKQLTSSAGWRKEASERKGNPVNGCCPVKYSPPVQDGGRENETLQRGVVL